MPRPEPQTEGTPVTIAQYVRLLAGQWIAVLLLTVVGAIGAGAFSLLATPVYEARAQLFVSTSGQTGSLGELTQGSTFTQQRVKSYTDLLTSPRVLEPVVTALGLDATAEGLSQRITATSPLDTVLINVTVQDDSPTRAAAIANAVALQFPKFVAELETRHGQEISPVKVSITRPAVPARAPISPRTTLNLALGLLVGLGLGVGTAVLRDSLDRTVSGRTEASELVGAPVLGAVIDDPQAAQSPLISYDAFSPRAEAFRQLRTNIRFLSVDRRVASMVVTGSVQAEGKTTTAANIAIALAQSGERVVLVDADLRRPSVAELFGMPSGVGLTTVLLGDTSVDTALQRWRDDLPLFLLTAGPPPPNPSELIGSARMAELVHHLTGHGLTVVVDSPPLLPVTDAAILARITDGALIVTRAASTKTDQLSAAAEALRTAGAPILGVVLNRVPRRGRGAGASGYRRYGSYLPNDAGQPVPAPPVAQPRASAPRDPVLPLVPPVARPGEVTHPGEPAGSLDAVLRPGEPATLLPPRPEDPLGPPPPFGSTPPATSVPEWHAVPTDLIDLRPAVDGSPAAVNGTVTVTTVNGNPAIINGTATVATVNGTTHGTHAQGTPDGAPSPYQPAPHSRPRGRRSAPPPEQPS